MPSPARELLPYEVISPFPQKRLEDFYHWTYQMSRNTDQIPKEEFLSFLNGLLQNPWAMSWGFIQDGELVGGCFFEPKGIDGGMHFAIDRKVWGQRLMHRGVPQMLAEAFIQCPSMQRISAWIPELNRSMKQLVEYVGFQPEGVMRRGACINGRIQNQIVYGLLREDLAYVLRRTQDHNNQQPTD